MPDLRDLLAQPADAFQLFLQELLIHVAAPYPDPWLLLGKCQTRATGLNATIVGWQRSRSDNNVASLAALGRQ
jgi:hypothetical protein